MILLQPDFPEAGQGREGFSLKISFFIKNQAILKVQAYSGAAGEAPGIAEELPPIIEEAPWVAEEVPPMVEEVSGIAEALPPIVEEVPRIVEALPSIIEEVPGIIEENSRIIREHGKIK